MLGKLNLFSKPPAEELLSAWYEALFPVDFVLLHTAPVYYGSGVPEGDDSGVVVIPGFDHGDAYLFVMHAWLRRIGYRPFYSGILVTFNSRDDATERQLNLTIDRAVAQTGRKVHLVGHSLGGVIGRYVAAQRPHDVASVITLGSPFRGAPGHPSTLRREERRASVLIRHRKDGNAYKVPLFEPVAIRDVALPRSVPQTAIYSRTDGVVDWRYCCTGNPKIDIEVRGTHAGLVFNPKVYQAIARRLAAGQRKKTAKTRRSPASQAMARSA